MYFELSITIKRSPSEVFGFLRDKDKYTHKDDSPVLLIEKITPDPPGIGTHYREVVQMLPFFRGEILSEITRFEVSKFLEEDFEGAGMKGHLAYQFLPEGNGTRLIQRETIRYTGLLRIFGPIVKRILSRRLSERLEDIKEVLESDLIDS